MCENIQLLATDARCVTSGLLPTLVGSESEQHATLLDLYTLT